MRTLIIGGGHLGRAIAKKMPESIIAHNQAEALELLSSPEPKQVVDTAWKSPNDKAARENEQLQWACRNEAMERLSAAKSIQLWVGIGSQGEIEPMRGCPKILTRGRPGVPAVSSPYGAAKHYLALATLAANFPSVWVRFGTIIHAKMPDDSVFRKAANAETLPVHKDTAVSVCTLSDAAAFIRRALLFRYSGVELCGTTVQLREALLRVNPNITFSEGQFGGYVFVGARDHTSHSERLLEECRDLGNKWRKSE